MINFIRDKKNIFAFIISIGLIVWSFYTLNCGYYVDENGLLTIYKGVYQGQRLFVDSWEALQTGGLLAYPLLALYYKGLSPLFTASAINIGLVLYMRIMYLICRLLIAAYLYATIKKTRYADGAYTAAMFYYMFVVVWSNFSYKSYCDMAVILMVCFLIRFYETRRYYYFSLIGIAVCISILAYPTMIFMAVAVGVLIIIGITRGEIEARALVYFVATCVVIGGAVCLYLQFTSGFENILSQISNLGDQDYEEGVVIRVGKILLSYLAIATIAYIPIGLIIFIKKFRYISEFTEGLFLTLYWCAFFIGVCVIRIESVSTSRFIYALLILYFWFPYFAYEKNETEYTKIGAYNTQIRNEKAVLWIVFIISTVAQLIWAASTNQDITVPGHMAVPVIVADIMLIGGVVKNLGGLVISVLVVDAFFMGFWVPEHYGGYSDVLATRYIVTNGELKGLALLPEDYDANERCYQLVTDYLTEDDYLLVAFGSNSTGYINSVAHQGTYSVYARTQLNTKLLDYYEINPDNQADYLLIDQSNPKYETFTEGETGKYLLGTYTNVVAESGDFVLLSK